MKIDRALAPRGKRRGETRDEGVAKTRGEARSPSECDAVITRCGARRETVENEDATRRTTAYRRARRLGIESVSPSASHRAVVVEFVNVKAQDSYAG